jgi:uncharacterized membrane protein YdjX (TVP38/TMEM64 family)
MMAAIKRFLPITIIIILIMIAYLTGFTRHLTWDNFEMVRRVAIENVEKHPYTSPLIYMGIYIIYASLALPGILLLTILGGFLFPLPLSTIYVICSATMGGSILFLSTRRASKNFLSKKVELFRRIEKGFRQNAAGYMLFLRLVPLFPCWFVTVSSALSGIRLTTFIWTTFIGIIPCAFLLTSMGAGIMMMLESKNHWAFYAY